MKNKILFAVITLLLFTKFTTQAALAQAGKVIEKPTPCEQTYYDMVTKVLNDLRTILPPERLKDAQTYIALVKQQGEISNQLLKMERSVFTSAELQGKMRTPYANYMQCKDMKLVVPTVTRQ